MLQPREEQWQRVEALAQELGDLPPDRLAQECARLAAEGESPTVLTLLGKWMDLPPPEAPLGAGAVLGGRYRLLEKLGEGGMGSVWRCRQELIGREVALKMIHPALATPTLRSQFLREMEVLGKLDHPGIVRIYDAGIHEAAGAREIPFFTMELVEGTPLRDWAAAHRNDPAAVVELGIRMGAALQGAHERRVVHRDLKPANVLVRPDGQPVVLDFGVARLMGLAAGDEACSFAGTPRYAAPEQHLGRDLDFRSGESVDVYALGLILFEMLAGRSPFQFSRGASLAEIAREVVEGSVACLAEVLPGCPELLDEVVARAMRRDPRDRYYSMTEMGRALSRVATTLGAPKPPAPAWSPAVGALVPGTQWRLEQKLGVGGAGEVWSAVHTQLDQRQVFKFCESEDKARTLRRELTLYRLLKERVGQNPHFIPLHDVSLDDPPWYLRMDAVEALDLPAWAAGIPGGVSGIPVETRIEIVAQVAEALQEAHDAGILHRDIKPANLLVRGTTPRPSSEGAARPWTVHVYVADFGIGQLVAEEWLPVGTPGGFTHTVFGLPRADGSGTILYLAPEVIERGATSARADLYSLGVVLWQLLAGNLHSALDPAGWAARIEDPLLREDLAGCLSGDPDRRWSGAGELATRLRALPERRAAQQRRLDEIAARERAAYRRGVVRASAVATALVAGFALLAWFAWSNGRVAVRNAAALSLQRAEGLPLTDLRAGRRQVGLALLEDAARATVPTNRPNLRSAAALVLGLSDLEPLPPEPTTFTAGPSRDAVPPRPGELARSWSADGRTLAIGRDLDGLNGTVDLLDAATGDIRLTIQRRPFPWIPIPEKGLLQFSPDGTFLAIAGPETSRHVLFCHTTNGAVHSYLFHGSDPLSVAWHPAGRVVATGCADGTVRLWDLSAAVSASAQAGPGNQFDLPPLLDVPAQDFSRVVLRVHGDPVRHLTFSADGRWLASLDDSGSLAIHRGFTPAGLPDLPDPAAAAERRSDAPRFEPTRAVVTLLERPREISSLATRSGNRLRIERNLGPAEEYRVNLGEMPAEWTLGPGVRDIAWNGDGSELGAVTATDLLWLRRADLAEFCAIRGPNPEGIAWDPISGDWVAPASDRYRTFRPEILTNVWRARPGPEGLPAEDLQLVAADPGAGARTDLASPGDGRFVIYRGRRLQFFSRHRPAPAHSALLVAEQQRSLRDLHWDRPGRLLTVLYGDSGRKTRLESWITTTNFPPTATALKPLDLEARQFVPAHDGSHGLARSDTLGLLRVHSESGLITVVDSSEAARQNGPLAVSPDGRRLALVVDRTRLQLRRLPDGAPHSELRSPGNSAVIALAWSPSGRHLAALLEDGRVHAWSLDSWQEWLSAHQLE